jgi:hypothetical protein
MIKTNLSFTWVPETSTIIVNRLRLNPRTVVCSAQQLVMNYDSTKRNLILF